MDFSDDKDTGANHLVRSVHCRRTEICMENRVVELFHRINRYKVLVGAIEHIMTFMRKLIDKVRCNNAPCAPATYKKAALHYVIHRVQSEYFSQEIKILKHGLQLPETFRI